MDALVPAHVGEAVNACYRSATVERCSDVGLDVRVDGSLKTGLGLLGLEESLELTLWCTNGRTRSDGAR